MIRKQIVPRQDATDDFDRIVDYYRLEAGQEVATRFVLALRSAYELLGDNPAIGEGRLGEQTGLQGLRTWPVRGFPYLICYAESADEIDIWRLLHRHRDLASIFGSEGD